jgi:hypothetical protein
LLISFSGEIEMAPSYPMILPQQANVAQPGYYQAPTAQAAALQLSGCPQQAQSWPFATQNMGLPMVSASHVPMAGGGQLAVGHPSGLDQYIYQMPQVFSAGAAEMAAGHHPAGALHYQRFDVGQLPMMDPVTQEGWKYVSGQPYHGAQYCFGPSSVC